MKKNFANKYNNNPWMNIFIFFFIILCSISIVYDPIARMYSDDILYFTGYKSLLFSARDNIWLLFGILGATILIVNRNTIGFILLNFCAIGMLISLACELIFNIVFYQNMFLYVLLLISAIIIIVMNFFEVRKKKYIINLNLVLIAILLNLLFIWQYS